MDRVRVLTLNIWNRSGPWEDRLAVIRAGVEALAPDLVGLQEVISVEGRSQADDIGRGLAGLEYHSAFGVAHDHGAGVLFGNAALSRWPIERQTVVPLPTGGTDETRSLLLAEVASPWGKLPFFVTHLNWKLHEGVVREAQVMAIADRVKKEAPIAGLPPILVGDFNAQPEATEIRYLGGLTSLAGRSVYFADSFGHAGQGRGVTFDTEGNGFAKPTLEPPRRIDYVFVRGPDERGRGRPLASRVVLDQPRDGVWASDHYGVLAEISMG
jgi:endonuclease/exonuclease/phosphatase family metal-dependent hydrolase